MSGTKVTRRPRKVPVSERCLQSAASRLLKGGNKLVSAEIFYIQKRLGQTATQVEIDEQVLAVRQVPWSRLVAEQA